MWVPPDPALTHVDAGGAARMVDVSAKDVTELPAGAPVDVVLIEGALQ